MGKSSKKAAIIFVILAAVFMISFFSGGIILKQIMGARSTEEEDPAKLEITMKAVIIDIQVKISGGIKKKVDRLMIQG